MTESVAVFIGLGVRHAVDQTFLFIGDVRNWALRACFAGIILALVAREAIVPANSAAILTQTMVVTQGRQY